MKQLRFILLMLVACVVQVSHAQDLFETWYEEGLVREKMIPVMLFSNGKNLADYQKQFEDIAQSLKGIHKYGNSEVLSVRQKEEYIVRHIESVMGNLSKWQKKLEKGKSLDFEDALWGALVSQHDGVMAAKYFDAAAKVAKDDSTKTILQLASIGCKYSTNKDKAAAAAAINFPIPDNCKKVATLIVNKYSMKDIPSEAIQQLFKVDKRLLTRAIRSNNIEELKKYESYDIPEVDSVLAVKEIPEVYNGSATLDYMWKCLIKHKMSWPLNYLHYQDLIKKSDVIPTFAFKLLFLMARKDEDNSLYFKTETDGEPLGYEMLDKMTHETSASSGKIDNEWYEYLNKFSSRSPVAALAMAIMIQAVEKVKSSDSDFDLMEYTSKLLGANDSEKAKSVEVINNAFSKFFSIRKDGAVTFKFQIPSWLSTTSGMDDDTKKRVAMMDELYLSLASWIYSSNIEESKEH